MDSEAAPETAKYAERLWDLGFCTFQAIHVAFKLDRDAMLRLTDPEGTNKGDPNRLDRFASYYPG